MASELFPIYDSFQSILCVSSVRRVYAVPYAGRSRNSCLMKIEIKKTKREMQLGSGNLRKFYWFFNSLV